MCFQGDNIQYVFLSESCLKIASRLFLAISAHWEASVVNQRRVLCRNRESVYARNSVLESKSFWLGCIATNNRPARLLVRVLITRFSLILLQHVSMLCWKWYLSKAWIMRMTRFVHFPSLDWPGTICWWMCVVTAREDGAILHRSPPPWTSFEANGTSADAPLLAIPQSNLNRCRVRLGIEIQIWILLGGHAYGRDFMFTEWYNEEFERGWWRLTCSRFMCK